jgi:outer membrane protein OmpA-like peptidoglycan-associated protein
MTSLRTLAAALLALTFAPLGGCLTNTAKPQVSQAVMDARAHVHVPSADPCAAQQTPLDQVSPVTVGFAFNDAAMPELAGHPLVSATHWLVCHPAMRVVIKPDSDTLGTPADRDALARRRGQAVYAYLTSQRVAPPRINVLPRGAAEPSGEHLLVLAEGRRW